MHLPITLIHKYRLLRNHIRTPGKGHHSALQNPHSLSVVCIRHSHTPVHLTHNRTSDSGTLPSAHSMDSRTSARINTVVRMSRPPLMPALTSFPVGEVSCYDHRVPTTCRRPNRSPHFALSYSRREACTRLRQRMGEDGTHT